MGSSTYNVYFTDRVSQPVLVGPAVAGHPSVGLWDLTTVDPADLSRFRIAGIESEAGIDPDDPSDFVFGLAPIDVPTNPDGAVEVVPIVALPAPAASAPWLLLPAWRLGATGWIAVQRRRRA